MNHEELQATFERLSTATLADAAVRVHAGIRVAPVGIRPVVAGSQLAGRALPVRHHGSVDVFLAALEDAAPGDVLVVDNGGRGDEACVGDLVVLEAASAGIAGLVIWGCHRDTPRLVAIDLPLFSYGACPNGPARERMGGAGRHAARFGAATVSQHDVVFADDDGALFLAAADLERVLAAAAEIARIEQEQADGVAYGRTLREQLRFPEYVAAQRRDPGYGFSDHLRRVNGTI